MSKGWSDERRKKQAERCRANRPWDHSSGPKTENGKARSSMNAFKHGGDTRTQELLREILGHNRATLATYQALLQNELKKSQLKQSSASPQSPHARNQTESVSGLVSQGQNDTNNDHD